MTRILALTKYGPKAASTRQRFLQYAPSLGLLGVELVCKPLFDDQFIDAINQGDRQSIRRLMSCYAKRLYALARPGSVDLIWVQYELFPYLPAAMERLALFTGIPVVVDYDDAFFHNYDLHRSAIVRRMLGKKMRPLISGAQMVIAGNEYLASYARQWNDRVSIVPTVVDTDLYFPAKLKGNRDVTVGWIGSPSTWTVYVRPYLSLLREICAETGARFLVVGAGNLAERDRFEGMELRAWNEAHEIAAIQEMDVGIMPLPDDPWARGKCGYKLIQYMACGLPVVASPVGVNSDIVTDGTTGFLATDNAAWLSALNRLITDAELRRRMGEAGRARAVKAYSVQAHGPRLVQMLQRTVINA